MNRITTAIAFGCLAALAGCAGLAGTFSIDSYLNKEITGDTFGACMARSYQAWARNRAWVQVDYLGAVELAKRAESVKPSAAGATVLICEDGSGAEKLKYDRFRDIAIADESRACACANALVEIERWTCAKPGDDKAKLKLRVDTAAAACEGR